MSSNEDLGVHRAADTFQMSWRREHWHARDTHCAGKLGCKSVCLSTVGEQRVEETYVMANRIMDSHEVGQAGSWGGFGKQRRRSLVSLQASSLPPACRCVGPKTFTFAPPRRSDPRRLPLIISA